MLVKQHPQAACHPIRSMDAVRYMYDGNIFNPFVTSIGNATYHGRHVHASSETALRPFDERQSKDAHAKSFTMWLFDAAQDH